MRQNFAYGRFGQRLDALLNKIIVAVIAEDKIDEYHLDKSGGEFLDQVCAQVSKYANINDTAYVKKMLIGTREPSANILGAVGAIFRLDDQSLSAQVTPNELRIDKEISRSDFSFFSGHHANGIYFDNMRPMSKMLYSGYYAVYFLERGNQYALSRGMLRIHDTFFDANILLCTILVGEEIWKGHLISDGHANQMLIENVRHHSEIVSIFCTRKMYEREDFRGIITSSHQGTITVRPIHFKFLGGELGKFGKSKNANKGETLFSIPKWHIDGGAINLNEADSDERLGQLLNAEIDIRYFGELPRDVPEIWTFASVEIRDPHAYLKKLMPNSESISLYEAENDESILRKGVFVEPKGDSTP